MTLKQRLARSFIYATIAVAASTVIVLILSSSNQPGVLSIGLVRAYYVAASPLAPGAVISFGIFGTMGPCASVGQVIGLFLIPIFSIAIDAGLIFAIWECLHRKRSRELASDHILHING